jgi:hypothetical protein
LVATLLSVNPATTSGRPAARTAAELTRNITVISSNIAGTFITAQVLDVRARSCGSARNSSLTKTRQRRKETT